MRRVQITETDAVEFGDGSVRRGCTEPLGATALALNQYRLAPGDGLPGGLHTHMDQEEVFVVLDGTATFETMEGTITVSESEVIRFGPGEFQSGRNKGDSDLVVLALGAPRDTEDTRIPVACPECAQETLRLEMDDEMTFVCPECDTAQTPRDCPNCGHEALRVRLPADETDTVVVCQGCDSEFDRPPLQD